ncbi:MAG TPA: hypothetical protein DC057_03255, partial [Spirochaetia bacterium]|nr:hypothetical protein [Spirochaetia bacterium]
MPIAPLLLSIILVIAGIITVFLSSWAFFRRNVNGAGEFGLFMISVSIYIFGYALEVARSDLSGILDAIKFEYTGIPYVSFFLLLFVFRFTTGHAIKPLYIVLLLIIPILSTILVYTMPYHTLFYINPRVVAGKFFPVLTFEKGPFYMVRFFYQQILSVGAVALLIFHLPEVDKKRKAQVISMLFGICIPWSLVFFYYIGIIPSDIDINPFSSAVIGIIFSITIFKFGLFELVPKAREMAVDSIQEAFIVLDKFNVVKDMNSAISILCHIIKPEIGKKLPEESE